MQKGVGDTARTRAQVAVASEVEVGRHGRSSARRSFIYCQSLIHIAHPECNRTFNPPTILGIFSSVYKLQDLHRLLQTKTRLQSLG